VIYVPVLLDGRDNVVSRGPVDCSDVLLVGWHRLDLELVEQRFEYQFEAETW